MDQAPDPMTPAPAPVTPPPAPAPAAPVMKEGSKGAAYGTIFGIILIVAILVVGAFYVWGARLNSQQPVPATENGAMMEEGVKIDTSMELAPN